MHYLLDKVTARLTVQGLLKLDENKELIPEEECAIDLFRQAASPKIRLFIVSATANMLQHLIKLPRYAPVIHLFLSRVEVAKTTRYYTRWARRLRGYAFTREDAAVIALATFGTSAEGSKDQPTIRSIR